MAGMFEVFVDPESNYRFRLTSPDGTVMAVSGIFADKRAVAAGIAAVRECAGTGLVTDLCPSVPASPPVPASASQAEVSHAAQPVCEDQRVAANRVHAFARAASLRRSVTTVPGPRWSGTA